MSLLRLEPRHAQGLVRRLDAKLSRPDAVALPSTRHPKEERDDVAPGTVLQELSPGYRLGDSLLRGLRQAEGKGTS